MEFAQVVLIEQVNATFLAADHGHVPAAYAIGQKQHARRAKVQIVMRKAERVKRSEVIDQRELATNHAQLHVTVREVIGTLKMPVLFGIELAVAK